MPDSPELVFGPAGLLRGLIEGGRPCDVFLSANTVHPAALGGAVLVFARNPISVVARRERCAVGLLAPLGQAILARHGFEPPA